MTPNQFKKQQCDMAFPVMFDNSPIGMVIGATDGSLSIVNDAFSRFLGYSQEELLEKSYQGITHPEDLAESAKYHKLINNGECDHYQLEKRYLRKNGQVVWGRLDVSLVRDEEGRPSYTVGQIIDITTNKHVEMENKFLQQRLAALWNISQLTNADFKTICDHILKEIVDMTRSPYGFYGFLNDQEDTMTIFSWSKQAMKDCAMEQKPLVFPIEESGVWGNAVRDRKPFMLNDYQDDCRHKRGVPDGHVALTRVLAVPVMNADKIVAVGAVANKSEDYCDTDLAQLIAFLNSVQILIERKKAEESLRDREKRYRRLYEETPVMMHSIDGNGTIVSVSDYWLKTLGYDRDEVIGHNLTDFFTEESYLYARDIVFPAFFEKGELKDIAYQFVKKSGEIVETLLSATSEYDKDGNFVRSLAVILDITEKKKLFEEQTRSAQLAALGTVAAGVAHEINNPINGIINYSALLQKRPDEPEMVLDVARRIEKESERIAKITSSLLHYSKDSRNDKFLVDLVEVVDGALSLIVPKISKSGILVETEFAQNLPAIRINPQSIQQVVINLMDNAYHALRYKDGGREEKNIKVCMQLVGDRSQQFCLQVRDNGVGMPEEVVKKAKDAFFSTKPSTEGTGLGLSIVDDIIKKHRGNMMIESREGAFTNIKVFLPVE